MAWQFDDRRALYLQICEKLTYAVVSGQYPTGARFPAVRELAMEAAVNPNTMQKALAELERQGILVSHRTAGRCVTEDPALIEAQRQALAQASTDAYLERMKQLGFDRDEAEALLRRRGKDADLPADANASEQDTTL